MSHDSHSHLPTSQLCSLLWIFYLAVMNLKRVQDTVGLNKTCLILGTPVLVIGLALDLVVNTFVMSVILLEMPQETTVTARLKRHKIHSDGYRLIKWLSGLKLYSMPLTLVATTFKVALV